MPIALALDLGGTKIAAARVSAAGVVTGRRETATPPEGGEAVVAAICSLIEKLSPGNVRALGICVPGLVHPDGSVWAPNIQGWTRMPLAARLTREFQLPVTIESDRDAFVTGEAWRGEYRTITRDGRVVWIRDEATLVRGSQGQPLCWQGVMWDITAQKTAAEG